MLKALLASAALLALPVQAVAQTAATPCLSQGEVRALTTFAMPSALSGLIDRCGPQLGPSGFMPTGGRALVAAYAARKQAAWPAARKAFFRLAGSKPSDKAMTETMAQMPDSALQPFVEGMIGAMIGAKLKPGQCVIADKLMRLLAPLPPENMTELLGTIFELADADDKQGPGGFKICKN
jgi:hypothetical protein